jgi:transketolase
MKQHLHLFELSQKLRIRILELAFKVGKSGSHVGGALSAADILVVLYNKYLKYSIEDYTNINRDRFILSKGHSANALYAILEQIGFLTKGEVDLFEVNGSPFYAHASRNIKKGIEFSGGSLSLGLSFGVGVALSCKRNALDNHIFVLVGDGECDEGLIWESLMSASNFNLSNLTVIVDCNGIQSDGFKKDVMNHFSLKDKFTAFGFHAVEIDGHNYSEICDAFDNRNKKKPNAIIAKTIKGKGVSFMENNVLWHHGVLNADQYEKAIQEQKMPFQ